MVKVLTDDNFKEEIKEGIVVVDFYADWCMPCKMMAPVLEKISEKVEDFKVMKLNTTDNPKMTAEYKIMMLPSFAVYKEGELIEIFTGARPEDDFISEVRNIVG
ncbi:MAG: thioredoxin domain-containing protein [Clostridia bacterium]|jgi:thioredoxin 1|nr:thioredoxin domain-containing protein [Clostridia bacterium]